MFYYQNVLQRHTGCFSTIWLAATKGIRITRRDLLRVNVRQTCEDIVDYVTVQVAPLWPQPSRPRFSLYLSSQLQYGVIVVYHRQCGFLLEEIQQTIERLVRSERYARIDLPELENQALNNPDLLVLLEEAEGAQDPFFGVMGFKNQQPCPYCIPQLMASATPERSLGTNSGTASESEGFKSPPDAITLKEERLVFVAPEFEGAELPEATGKEIDMLLEQPDQFHNEEERENDRAGDRSKDMEPGMTSIDQLKVSAVGGDSVGLLDEDLGQALEVTPALTDAFGRRTEKAPEGHCGKLLNIDAPPKRGRRRQLIFADPHVQISQDAMRLQIEDTLTESVPMSQVLISLPAHRTIAELFNTPTSSLLHPDLLSLWTQCASFRTPAHHGDKTGHWEMEDDGSSGLDPLRKEGEMERMKSEVELRRRRNHCMRDIPKELLESEGTAPSEASVEFLLDVSNEDKSLEQITPVSIGSLIEGALVPMESILEEIVDLPDGDAEAREDTSEALLSWVSSLLRKFGKVNFQSLLPLEADRTTAAHMLSKLLVLVSTRDLSVYQVEPYSPITIIPGPLNTEDFPRFTLS